MEKNILIAGATGYVGGKLLKRLQLEGHVIRCLARTPSKLEGKLPSSRIHEGDLLDLATLWRPFELSETAYYLVHSMGDGGNRFAEDEIEAAENFSLMARATGIKRIVYLGGLGDSKDGLSPHLESRQKVGRILRNSGIETIELRASIVLGAGSLSFDMIRTLCERLPAMTTPRWVSVKAQPIGIQDLLDYLVQAMDIEPGGSRVFEIGGTDRLSYGELMELYASKRQLKRVMIPVPFLSPRLSSHWLGLVTPLQARIGRKLIESIRNPTVVEDRSADTFFDVDPGSAADAMEAALREIEASIPLAG